MGEAFEAGQGLKGMAKAIPVPPDLVTTKNVAFVKADMTITE